MAYVVIEISVPNQGIPSLNDRCQNPTKPNDEINLLRNLMDAINGGLINASVQVTVRSTTSSISTNGSGSTQYNYSKL